MNTLLELVEWGEWLHDQSSQIYVAKVGLKLWPLNLPFDALQSANFLSPINLPHRLIVLWFNNTSTPVGHFVSSSRERKTTDRGESTGDEREGQGERKMIESEETEEKKTFPLYPYLQQG